MISRSVPLKRTPLKRKPRKKRKGENPEYLAWLRSRHCAVPIFLPGGFWVEHRESAGCGGTVEAAHVGERGLGQKCSDAQAIPLCSQHHRIGATSNHVLGKSFWEYHGINRKEVIEKLNAMYEQETGKKP